MADIEKMLATYTSKMEDSMSSKIGELRGVMKEQVQEAVAAATGVRSPSPQTTPAEIPVAVHKRPFISIPSDQSFNGAGDKRSAQQFLSTLEANYNSNREYYLSHDDSRRVWDVRLSLREPALSWFDTTSQTDPTFAQPYSLFLMAFRSRFMLDLVIERPLDKLRSLRMSKGHVAAYTNLFNQYMGECKFLHLSAVSYITDYRLGLEKELQARLEVSRVGLKGALVEWSTLEEIQSTAVSLGEPVVAAPVKVAAVVMGEKGKGEKKDYRQKESEQERQHRMATKFCSYCERRGHVVEECRDKKNGMPGVVKPAGQE
jgi:hypothetical protein